MLKVVRPLMLTRDNDGKLVAYTSIMRNEKTGRHTSVSCHANKVKGKSEMYKQVSKELKRLNKE
jgi:roadblock/LC7 domain-containing protein